MNILLLWWTLDSFRNSGSLAWTRNEIRKVCHRLFQRKNKGM